MPNLPANPLQGLIAAAGKLPATGPVDERRRRLESAGPARVILCDTSGSMAESAGARTRIRLLQEALDAQPLTPEDHVLAFGSTAAECNPTALPAPAGGTALHLALLAAAAFRPRQTLVISDGRPDSQDAALAAATQLSGVIDVIYVGPDDDSDAIAFMHRLARAGCGRVLVHDITRSASQPRPLAQSLTHMLALPKPRST